MDTETLMTTWCRMWDTDPALAHDVMTTDCVQWSAQTPGLDPLVGPSDQETFAAAYRARGVNRFRPWLLVDGGDRFSYLWDVTAPDGTVRTGADVNDVRGGRVARNWTSVGQRPVAATDLDRVPVEPTETADLERLSAGWVGLWAATGTPETDQVVTGDVDVFLGAGPIAGLQGAEALADHLERERQRSGAVPALHGSPVLDAARGRFAVLRTTSTGTTAAGTIDVVSVRDGRIARVWSLPGTRPFRY